MPKKKPTATTPGSAKRSTKKAGTTKRSRKLSPQDHVTVTIAGPARAVRRTLSDLNFTGLWNRTVAREIALDQTGVPDADLDDELGGERVALFSQDARDMYRQRCVNEAGRRGHPVANPAKIPADSDTTVMEVGDALFDNARS